MIRASTRAGLAPVLRSGSRVLPSVTSATAFPELNVRKPDMYMRKQCTEVAPAAGVGARFALTAEVLVSKIFPAGFGWQAGSLVADQKFGLGADTMGFALTTGVGDFTGVLVGHTVFYAIKNACSDIGSQ